MTTRTKTAAPMPHIWLDETGRAWIDDAKVQGIESVNLRQVGSEPLA